MARRPGAFRGVTPKKIIQTLDIGGGELFRSVDQSARKYPDRQYAVADPKAQDFGSKNVTVFRKKALEALGQAREEEIKFRHMRINMPQGSLAKPDYLRKVLRKAKHVLLPNGKIFIRTNDLKLLEEIQPIFRQEGFSIKPLVEIHKNEWTHDMHITDSGVREHASTEATFWRIEATFSPKEARKMQRKV